LTGPRGGDLELTVARAPQSGCAVPETLKKVQVKIYGFDDKLASTRNLDGVAAEILAKGAGETIAAFVSMNWVMPGLRYKEYRVWLRGQRKAFANCSPTAFILR